jgi:hypothetical protein
MGNPCPSLLLSAATVDDRSFKSDYFLPCEQVDVFKDEVPQCDQYAEDDMVCEH